jgi:hypothetical protein
MTIQRSLPSPGSAERATLTGFLDFQRATRELVAAVPSLDTEGERGGQRFTVRWVLVHMIEEYARHNGHADLLRERLDGSTGE